MTKTVLTPASSMLLVAPRTALVSTVVIAATLLAALLFGLVAVVADPIMVGLALGLLAGTILLARPAWNVSLLITGGMIIVGLLPIWIHGVATKAVWGISLLGFVLFACALSTLVVSRELANRTPGFIWAALAFMIYAVMNSLIQWYSPSEFLGGTKRYFQMWGLLFAFSWITFGEQTVRRWLMLILIIAILQLPFAVYERLALVPLRESLANSVPIDIVAGTFGADLYRGGANSEMATFLLIVFAFLMARRMEHVLSLRRFLLLAPLVLAPVFLGETKAVVVQLPLIFIVLYRRTLLARPLYGLMALVIGTMLTAAAGYTYLQFSPRSLENQIANTLRYNVYEKGYGLYLLNRTTVLKFWAERQSVSDPVSTMFGNGLGSSHDQTDGHISAHYPGYGVGLTAAATLLWDTGVIGFGLFVTILALAWRTASQLLRRTQDPLVRADATAIQCTLPIFLFYLFFRLSVLEVISFQIVFTAALGYLAWLHCRHAKSSVATSG